MKKTLKLAVAAAALSTPAVAANLENPLYLPTAGELYSKTGAGVMLKVADASDAHVKKNHDGATEFPILRVSEELGIGITDNFAVRGAFAYTQDDDINRKGMNHGRLGAIYRAVDTLDGVKMDIYADAVLGGISKMTGAYTHTPLGFNYDNYSTGRYGVDVGVRFGKTWSKLTTSGFVEILRTFGSHNNEIDVTTAEAAPGLGLVALGFPDTISVNLRDTTEINFGLNAFYQIDDRWSWGALFKYTHHADNGVESLHSKVDTAKGDATLAYLASNDLVQPGMKTQHIISALESQLADMQDGFDEYMIGASVAYQLTDTTQVAAYAEYTFDTAHDNSQNGTDVKAEAGVRLNVAF